MTTVRAIVSDALREGGILGLGETMEADAFDEGLRRLQTIIKFIVGTELGENLVDITYDTNGISLNHTNQDDETTEIDSTFALSNSRLLCNLSGAKTVYLNPNPRDGARFGVIDITGNFSTANLTLDANGRNIEAAPTVTLSTDSLNREWFYRADLGNWVQLTDIDEYGNSPFPEEFDDYLIFSLAGRLNPRYGVQTAPETVELFRRSRNAFKARYRQQQQVGSEFALQKIHPWNTWYYSYGDNIRFNLGKS
jgi:hypothetical protein